ncbi:hypothetical protein NDA01_31095 [Trichocoleus desertorum AS-A10]
MLKLKQSQRSSFGLAFAAPVYSKRLPLWIVVPLLAGSSPVVRPGSSD